MKFDRTAILRPGLFNRGDGRRGWLEQMFAVGGVPPMRIKGKTKCFYELVIFLILKSLPAR
jgi:hypothetical protein